MTLKKLIVDPSTIDGLQTEVHKNLWTAYNKQNPDYIDCLIGFHKMSLEKRKEIFGIQNDPWASQKIGISRFYNKVRKILGLPRQKIDWVNTTVPKYSEEFPVLDYVDRDITGNQWIEVYKKLFGEDMVFDNYYSKNIDSEIHIQQTRSIGNYAYSHKGGVEPDAVHLNDSYDMFSVDGNNYMVPIEGIVFATRYCFETDDMLDVKGITHFHALVSDDKTMHMGRNGHGMLSVGCGNRDSRGICYGPRQVNF